MPRSYTLLSLLSLLSLFSGCNALQLGQPLRIEPGDWTTAGGSTSRAHTTDATLALPLEQAWRYDADAAFGPAAVVAADGVLIVATQKGEIHAIEVETGKRRGVGNLREPITGAPVLTNRVLYAPVADGKRTLVAYDIERGERKWELRVGPHEAGLLLDGGTLVAAGLDGIVRGIEPGSGEVRWTATPDSAAGFFAAPVTMAPGRIAVADDRGRVTALDLATGAVAWTRDLGLPVYASPAAGGGRLFIPTTRGRFLALDAATGEAVWTFEAARPTVRFSPPAVSGNRIVVGSSDGMLRALDATTGDVRWSFHSDGNFASAPLVAGSVVYVGSMNETLYALDADSGEVLWQTELDGRVKSEPVLHDGYLIVLAEPKYAYAFTAAPPVAATTPEP